VQGNLDKMLPLAAGSLLTYCPQLSVVEGNLSLFASLLLNKFSAVSRILMFRLDKRYLKLATIS